MSFPSWASRVASASAVAALVLIAAPAAKADVKAFDLSGTSVTKDTFAGTIDLDFTNDTVTSVDVTVDGFSGAYAFNQIQSFTFALAGSIAVVEVSDTPGDVLSLFFLVPSANTFQNFVGGASAQIVAQGPFGGGTGFLFDATGPITPDSSDQSDPPDPPAVPEPSTWVMMLLGFVGLGLAAKGRRAIRFLAKA
jgi:PEP-CTERM motif